MAFYNTIHEVGDKLKESHKKARSQEDLIYSYLLIAGKPLVPSQILKRLALNCPITSIRRALTNLTNRGLLIKTDKFIIGSFGKREHLWKVKTSEDDIDPNQFSLFGE